MAMARSGLRNVGQGAAVNFLREEVLSLLSTQLEKQPPANGMDDFDPSDNRHMVKAYTL